MGILPWSAKNKTSKRREQKASSLQLSCELQQQQQLQKKKKVFMFAVQTRAHTHSPYRLSVSQADRALSCSIRGSPVIENLRYSGCSVDHTIHIYLPSFPKLLCTFISLRASTYCVRSLRQRLPEHRRWKIRKKNLRHQIFVSEVMQQA